MCCPDTAALLLVVTGEKAVVEAFEWGCCVSFFFFFFFRPHMQDFAEGACGSTFRGHKPVDLMLSHALYLACMHRPQGPSRWASDVFVTAWSPEHSPQATSMSERAPTRAGQVCHGNATLSQLDVGVLGLRCTFPSGELAAFGSLNTLFIAIDDWYMAYSVRANPPSCRQAVSQKVTKLPGAPVRTGCTCMFQPMIP